MIHRSNERDKVRRDTSMSNTQATTADVPEDTHTIQDLAHASNTDIQAHTEMREHTGMRREAHMDTERHMQFPEMHPDSRESSSSVFQNRYLMKTTDVREYETLRGSSVRDGTSQADTREAYERLVQRSREEMAQERRRNGGIMSMFNGWLSKIRTENAQRDRIRTRAFYAAKAVRARPFPRVLELSEEDERFVMSLWEQEDGSEVCASIDSVGITASQLRCLQPGEWLNDEVINAYLSMIVHRSADKCARPLSTQERLDGTRPLKCFAFSTFFWVTLTEPQYDYQRVRRWTTRKKVDIFDHDLVFVPLHIHKVHWALGVIDMKSELIFYFDSLGEEPDPEYLLAMKKYLNDEHKDKKGCEMPNLSSWMLGGNNFSLSVLTPTTLRETLNAHPDYATTGVDPSTHTYIPLQTNGSDCGVFTCLFAECLSLSRFPFDFQSSDIVTRRMLMVKQLVDGEADEGVLLTDDKLAL